MNALAAAPPPLRTRRLPDLSALRPRPRVSHDVGATLVGREDFGPALARFRLRPDDAPLDFQAGQYVQVRLADGDGPARPYSIASRPGERDVELIVSLVEGGALSPRLLALPLGARLVLGQPVGLFRLQPDDERTHLLLGTGSGIAPLLSMVAALAGRPRPPRTVVWHGVRRGAELAGRAELERLEGTWLSYRPTLSRPTTTPDWHGRTGRLGGHLADLASSGWLDQRETVAYLCGSAAMIEECRALLMAAGLPDHAIRFERFNPA